MEIVTGYTGAAHITSAQDRAGNQGAYGTGSYILNVGSLLAPTIVSANEVRIADGVISHQGCIGIIESGTYDSLAITSGSQDTYRYDLIVARYEKDASTNVESLALVVIEGTETSDTPTDPDYNTGDIQEGDTPVDFPLFRVVIEGITISSVDQIPDNIMTQAESDALIGSTDISSIGGGTLTGAISTLNGNVRPYLTKTVEKAASNANYISSGIDARLYHVLSAYEQPPNGIGAVCNLGCNGSAVTAYFYSANGTPYTGAITVVFIYVAI